MNKLFIVPVTLALLSSLSGVAFAEQATVRSRTADLRAEPSSMGKAKVKLGAGREVSVVGKSNDGEWLRVKAEITHADETIKFEGWLAAADLGMSGSSASVPVDNSAPKKDAADLSWVSDDTSATAAPASNDEWADSADNKALPAVSDTSSNDNSWDSTPATAAPAKDESSGSGNEGWGSSSSDSGSSDSSDAAAGW